MNPIKKFLIVMGFIKPKFEILKQKTKEINYNDYNYSNNKILDTNWQKDIYKNRCRVKE